MISYERRRSLAFLIALAASGNCAFAEVSVNNSHEFSIIEDGGGSDPGPIPTWQLIRPDLPAESVLNQNGDQNGDGPPAFTINPLTGNPEVVWAWWDGTDHEIAYSVWTGSAWSVPEILTNNTTEDTRPTIVVGLDGARHISWWRGGTIDQVYYLWKPAAGGLGPEEIVTRVAVGGTRPGISLAISGPRVGYQQDQAGGPTQIVVSRKVVTGWEQETIATTSYAGPRGDGDLDVQSHALGGRLWVDWVNDAGQLAYSTYDTQSGTWSAPQAMPYSWDLASGVSERTAREFGRISIRLAVQQQH